MSQFREFIQNIRDAILPPERRAMRNALRWWSVDGGPVMWRRY